jgi:altronate dehydratase
MASAKMPKVFAYRRENGRVGIRNHVVILPLDDLSNSACEKVAYNVKGCKAFPTPTDGCSSARTSSSSSAP